MRKPTYAHQWMKLFNTGADYLIECGLSKKIAAQEFSLLIWLARQHEPDSISVKMTLQEVADELQLDPGRVRTLMSRLRKNRLATTYKAAKGGTRFIILNPDLFLFSNNPAVIGWHRGQWRECS